MRNQDLSIVINLPLQSQQNLSTRHITVYLMLEIIYNSRATARVDLGQPMARDPSKVSEKIFDDYQTEELV